MNKVQNHSVRCHFRSVQREEVKSLLERYGNPIMAIPERTGAYIEDEILKCIGYEPLYIFTRTGVIGVKNGETYRLVKK